MSFSDEDTKNELYKITSGIPFNLQLIGKEIQYLELKKIDKKKLIQTVKDVLEKEGEQSFREFVESLSPSEIKVLRGLAKNPKLSPIDISKQEFIDESSVNNSLSLLRKKGLIRKLDRGKYEFTDNLFSEWLKHHDSL